MRRAPKFPSSMNTRFLLRMWRRGEASALTMAWLSLEKMALGGLNDQLGGGFHRYSTDAKWLVPHFEKMLYDNALLSVAYTEAWQTLRAQEGEAPDGAPWSSKAAFFKRTAERALDWIDREMSDPNGGFYSATDADSEGEEGTYFVWKRHEVEAILGEDAAAVCKLFDVTPEGNFEGSNIFSLAKVPSAGEQALLDRASAKLLEVREKRPPPLTDRKVLTAWNGLAISAFARAGFAFDRPELIARAARAASMLLEKHRDAAGNLMRSSLEGNPRHSGLLEDHAFLAAGLVDLFEATGEARWLHEALALHAALESRFADGDGGYFRSPTRTRSLARPREARLRRRRAGTGNSVAALTLFSSYKFDRRSSACRARPQAPAIVRHDVGGLAARPRRNAPGSRIRPRHPARIGPHPQQRRQRTSQLLDLIRGRSAPHLLDRPRRRGSPAGSYRQRHIGQLVIDRRAPGRPDHGLPSAAKGACGLLVATSAAVLSEQLWSVVRSCVSSVCKIL